MAEKQDEHQPLRRALWARALFILPFVAMLFVSSYNRVEPAAFGVPFFYWYQLLWIVLSAIVCVIVYQIER